MKKIIYLLAVMGVLFSSCNPLEDINNDADAQENSIEGHAEYTLTEDDYISIGLDIGSFDTVDEAKQLIPEFLSSTHPFSFWGQESSVLVNFNLTDGNPEDVSAFVNAGVYQLQSGDYPIANSNAFFPNDDPTDYLESILESQIASPVEGQVVRTGYRQFVNEPEIGFTPLVAYDFSTGFNGWNIVEESGSDAVWTEQTGYIQANGFFGGAVANEEWLVSPTIDLSSQTNLKFQMAQALKYYTDPSLVKILVSTDYSGDVLTANWDLISFSALPALDDWNALSEDYDFSAYDGQQVNVAFKYESTGTDAARWRISGMFIKVPGYSGPSMTKSNYYKYNGSSWDLVNNVYYLSSEDYDLMGTGSGEPGQYNNFSSSSLPENYIPTFLDIKYPFAQEGDKWFITYKYYDGSTTLTKGNLYTFTNGAWAASVSSLKFGFDNGVWVPDNTIRYTLTNADYEYIGNTLSSDPEYSGITNTLIQYHDYDYNWSSDQILYSLGVFLDYYDPTAAEDQKYQITYLLYDSGIQELTASLKKVGGEWIAD